MTLLWWLAEEEADRLHVGADCASVHAKLVPVLHRTTLLTHRRQRTSWPRYTHHGRRASAPWLQVGSDQSCSWCSLAALIEFAQQSIERSTVIYRGWQAIVLGGKIQDLWRTFNRLFQTYFSDALQSDVEV